MRVLPAELHRDLKNLDWLLTVLDVVDHGSKEAVADRTNLKLDTISKTIRDVSSAMGQERLFVQEPGGTMRPTAFLEDQVDTMRAMISLWAKLTRARSNTCAIAFLPQHSAFVADALGKLRNVETTLHPLGEHDRSEAGFARTIDKVARGELDLAVGLGSLKRLPKGATSQTRNQRDDVRSEVLYRSQLVAMVARDEELDQIEVEQLVERQLLLPPGDTRSRQRLNEAIDAAGLPELTGENVRLEAYGTKVLVAFGSYKHGTVVVPSDIAYPFQESHQLAGDWARAFKWIPVTRGGQPVDHSVYVTRRPETTDTILDVAEELRRAATRMGLNTRGS